MSGVLMFSGTTEGKMLAYSLASRGVHVHVKVATEYGADVMEPMDNIIVDPGSCGGTDGIAKLIAENGYDVVVDATHPYATRISEHIRDACGYMGTDLMRIARGPGDVFPDGILTVEDTDAAVDLLSKEEGNILVTTGSNDLDKFTRIPEYRDRVTARVLSIASSMQRAVSLGFEGANLICAQGPFSEDANYAHLMSSDARWMVTKDSGTIGGFEDKVKAARRAGARIVLIRRPDDAGMSYDDALSTLETRFGLDHEASDIPCRKRRVGLVGIGMGPGDLTLKAARRVSEADILIGARRMLESVDTGGRAVLEEYRSDEIVSYLDSHPEYGDAVVLLSGDVGFYSGAKKLLERLKGSMYEVDVECGISSAVYLCSKIDESWQDVHMCSSHGRDSNLIGLCRTHGKVFTLLSGNGSVHDMCQRFVEYGMDVTVTVGQCFGYPEEMIVSGSPAELMDVTFGDLCVALIRNGHADRRNPLSLHDSDFIRGDAPMTKSEVRTLSVAKLKLEDDSIVYDVGAGTGSVSIEMALNAVNGHVYAIEKETDATSLIEQNKKRFLVDNLTVINGLAPAAMEDLPVPTHAFIGGSSGNLKDIVSTLLEKNPGIRIVINSVTLETLCETMDVIKDLGLVEEETVCINVSYARILGRYHLMTAQNPVYISVVRG